MKKQALSLLVLLIHANLFEATISIDVVHPKERKVQLKKPVEGAYFWANFQLYELDRQDKIQITRDRIRLINKLVAERQLTLIFEPKEGTKATIVFENWLAD